MTATAYRSARAVRAGDRTPANTKAVSRRGGASSARLVVAMMPSSSPDSGASPSIKAILWKDRASILRERSTAREERTLRSAWRETTGQPGAVTVPTVGSSHHDGDIVPRDVRITRDQHEPSESCLRHQQTVKRITMMHGQVRARLDM